ncbi:MAG TPA: 1-acyl-sn-glycerol-3-phosphate acyltransferase [Actinobacteria bacterium]|nr:1-acyl-sn-glycerol-3-phosphate acyltransferase [Actinomycetota bacterium]
MRTTLRNVLRSALLIPGFFLLTISLAGVVLVLAHRDPDDARIERILQWWSDRFLRLPPVDYELHGVDRIDPTRRYVFVSNHLSNFDIPLLLRGIPVRIRFLAKAELYRIPLFGRAMDRVGVVKIDRTRATSAHQAINRAAREVLGRGYSLIVFPEGTRSRSGDMLPFKKGAFRIAIDNEVPIVPVVLCGTHDVYPPGAWTFRPGRASLTILEPVETVGMDVDDLEPLLEKVRAEMVAHYEEQRTRGCVQS